MRTCFSTRSRCRAPSSSAEPPSPGSERDGRLLSLSAGACLLVAVCLVATTGCSDDVFCVDDPALYISATIEEIGLARAGSTYVEVYCSNDPLPGKFDVVVSDTTLPEATQAPDHLGLVTSLTETLVIWQPGTNCFLEVTTEYGVASAHEPVPGAFEVAAPGTIALGEILTLVWTASDNASYYVVQASLEGSRGTWDIDVAVEGTTTTFGPSELTSTGIFSGRVWAVAGPFPKAGSAGNVTGAGGGFLNVSYRDPGSEFEVVVED